MTREKKQAPVEVEGWPHLSEEIEAEIVRARAKFPDPRMLFTALVEEVGELTEALMGNGNDPASRAEGAVHKEAIQVAAVVCRLVLEGDPLYGEAAPRTE